MIVLILCSSTSISCLSLTCSLTCYAFSMGLLLDIISLTASETISLTCSVSFSYCFRSRSFIGSFFDSLTSRWTRVGLTRNCLAISIWSLLSVVHALMISSISVVDRVERVRFLYLDPAGAFSTALCLNSFSSKPSALLALVECFKPFRDRKGS